MRNHSQMIFHLENAEKMYSKMRTTVAKDILSHAARQIHDGAIYTLTIVVTSNVSGCKQEVQRSNILSKVT